MLYKDKVIEVGQLTQEELVDLYVHRMLFGQELYYPDHSMRDFYEMGGFFKWVNFCYILRSEIDFSPSLAKISVCILTHNNAKIIKSVIEAIRPIAFEVIVVDSQSSDGTREIVQNLVDRFLSVDNNLGFDIKRNAAIRAAKGDWVLMLDSDEAISQMAFLPIRRYISWAEKKDVDVLWLPRYWVKKSRGKTFQHYVGELCLWPDPQARLFRVSANCFYKGFIHEKLYSKKDGKACFISNENCGIYHFKYWMNSNDDLAQTARQRIALQSENMDMVQLLPWVYKKQTREILGITQAKNIHPIIDTLLNTY